MTVLRSGSASDVGRVRSVNEDLALETLTLFAVADGMGGHAGGEVASRVAIDALRDEFGRDPSESGLISAVRKANLAVWERSRDDAEVRGMGTTVTAAALVATPEGDRLVLANVGDSRAYRMRGGRLDQLTQDHSVAEELVSRGELSEAEAAVHPHRHILTRALGVGPEVDVDAWEVQPQQGDRYLLCSDGLSNEVSPDRIAGVLSRSGEPQRAADTLVRMANEHGGSDNITAVVIDVVVGDPAVDDEGGAGARQLLAPGASAPPASRDRTPLGAPVVTEDGSPYSGGGGVDPGATGVTATTGGTSEGPGYEPVVVAPAVVASGPASATLSGVQGFGPATAAPTVTAGSPAWAAGDGVAATAGSDSQTGVVPAVRVVSAAETVPELRAASRDRSDGHDAPKRRRAITVRSVLFVLLLGAIGYGAYAVVHWYIDNSYFVRTSGTQLVIYQGRPAGFLWIKPKPVDRTGISTSQVPPTFVSTLRQGVEEPSLSAAKHYVANLAAEQRTLAQVGAAGGTTPSTGTTPAGGTTPTAPPPTS